MFYDTVFFLSPNAEVAGAKVSLVSVGKYLFDVPPGVTIQALHNAVPPVDQSAQVVALTAEVARLQGIIDALPPPPPPPDLTPVTITQAQIDTLKSDAAQLRADLAAV
jgi:hypothetical protein